ncbi:hypothetical protein CI105_04075 [Candidatus Izimaplasma bacterium ZiA1]|uniref:permease prefix domain 1-containing protein n=1 Tax=Candidatus Izimoplasma sp. ZiA1 TaxID=2024899 RepID=UPI000BAA3A7D|nr:hypothetical protein CI105_04075 [Candidatus Izimaplasma bacterium ZiA1]
MRHIENFVKNIFKDMPKSQQKEEIIKNTIISLMEKVEDLMEKGLSEQEATDKAVIEFGTIEDYYDDVKKKEKREKRIKTIKHYQNDLFFSVVATIIIIAILAFVNFSYSTGYWFVLPSLGLLFWPLALLYKLFNKRGDK